MISDVIDPRRCQRCRMFFVLCFCSELTALTTRHRISLVIHHTEYRKPTNTGRLAHLALSNSSLFVRGIPGGALLTGEFLLPEYRAAVLFPSEHAVPVSEWLEQAETPVQLIVPDGNWNQASKCVKREKLLKELPHVILHKNEESRYRLIRKTTRPGGLATIEAIAMALEDLKEVKASQHLLHLFETLMERVLITRGKLPRKNFILS